MMIYSERTAFIAFTSHSLCWRVAENVRLPN
jgi:hypothetical protein